MYLKIRPPTKYFPCLGSPTALSIVIENSKARHDTIYITDAQWYCFAQQPVWSHMVDNNGAIIYFVRRNWIIIQIWVAVVLAPW